MTEIREKSAISVSEKVRVVYEGETVDADELSFKVQADPVLSCEVSDGAIIEVRHQVKSIYRLRDKKKPDGSPIYIMTGRVETKTIPATAKD
jgi:hypothetical protein